MTNRRVIKDCPDDPHRPRRRSRRRFAATAPRHREEARLADQTLAPAAQLAAKGRTPFPGESEAYRAARRALLAEEIEFRRHMTRLVEQRRALPDGPVIEKTYRFKDANGADLGLLDLFGDKDVLVSYFWMFGPQRERPCPMCANWLGAVAGNAADIKQRVALKIQDVRAVGDDWRVTARVVVA